MKCQDKKLQIQDEPRVTHSKVSQREKNKHHNINKYMWNQENDNDESICRVGTFAEAQTEITQICGHRRRKERVGKFKQ